LSEFDPNELELPFRGPSYGEKFHQNRVITAAMGDQDREINKQTDASDFIICPMLRYSDGTDKNTESIKTHLYGATLLTNRSG